MNEPYRIIGEIFNVIGIRGVDPRIIKEKVDALSLDNYEVTLLSREHITDPERNLSFLHTLPEYDLKQITETHHEWLCRYGYLPVQSASIYL